jgi:hypothetical protein
MEQMQRNWLIPKWCENRYKGKGLKHHLYPNFRPISLLSISGKVLEGLMYNQLEAFLIRYNILFKSQYGFRAGHSTIHAVIDFVGKINEALEKGKLCYGIFCDLSKSFDAINHDIVLEKIAPLWYQRPGSGMVPQLS